MKRQRDGCTGSGGLIVDSGLQHSGEGEDEDIFFGCGFGEEEEAGVVATAVMGVAKVKGGDKEGEKEDEKVVEEDGVDGDEEEDLDLKVEVEVEEEFGEEAVEEEEVVEEEAAEGTGGGKKPVEEGGGGGSKKPPPSTVEEGKGGGSSSGSGTTSGSGSSSTSASGSGSGSGSHASTGEKAKVREKQYVMYTEVPLPTPAPLDRSLYIPTGVLVPPYTEGVETMREFVSRVSVGMAATGLARCTLKLPSLAACASVEPESLLASKDLLEKALGKSYKMRCYAYTFDKSTDTAVQGSYTLKYTRKEPTYTASKFFARCSTEEAQGPFSSLPREGAFSDRAYWQGVEACVGDEFPLHYPSDVEASLLAFVPDFPQAWDLSRFNAQNDLLRALIPYLGFKGNTVSGYTTPNVYVGGPGTTFALHAEDQNLFSCNYLLAGSPKVWYAVPPQYYSRVIEFVHKRAFPSNALVKTCPQAVMHKRFLVHPEELHAAGIPTSRIIQYPGDMVITYPGAFHMGYNTGWNIAEASNFATEVWWKGGHFHDATAVGDCKCKENTRFAFDDDDCRAGLEIVGAKFGISRADL